jgi:hypothetical protein
MLHRLRLFIVGIGTGYKCVKGSVIIHGQSLMV